ncbi:acyl-CoA N-acyltransferase, partial [Mycena belliarum]
MANDELSTGSKEVKAANKASASQILKCIPTDSESPGHSFEVILAEKLDGAARSSIWSLFETNMRPMYTASSFGWDPPHKKGELFDHLSRFILVYPKDESRSLVAFTAFRFEFEEGQNILYCYDLQVSKKSQRHGLGRQLMNHLARIGAAFRLDKIMLTVFKANPRALMFYADFGFEVDPDSPGDEDEEDYKILSKKCLI